MVDVAIQRRFALALPSNGTKKWRSAVIVRNEFKDRVLTIAAADVERLVLNARIEQAGSTNIGLALFLQVAGAILTSMDLPTPSGASATADLLTSSGGAVRYNLLSQSGTGIDFNQTTPAFWGTQSVTIGRATRDEIVSPPSVLADGEIGAPLILMPGQALELIASALLAQSVHTWFNGFFRAKGSLADL